MQPSLPPARSIRYAPAFLCGVALAVLLAVDLVSPLAVPMGILYAGLLALLVRLGHKNYLIFVAGLASLVTVLDIAVHREAIGEAVVRVNVGISFVAIWGTAIALLHFLRVRDSTVEALKHSEEKYRALFEHAPVGIITVDSGGSIVSFNSNALTMFGYDRAEFAGLQLEALVPEHLRSRHQRYRRSYMSRPTQRPMGEGGQLLGRRRDGTVFPVSISLYPIETARGTVAVAHIADITEHRKAEQKFRSLLESAPDAMVIVNEVGVIRLANKRTEELFGYTPTELIGNKVEVLMPGRFRSRHTGHRMDYFLAPKSRGMGEGLELFGQTRDGKEFPVEISLSPLETDEGLWISAAIRDISERKHAEQELARHTEQLETSNQQLEHFAYIVSHDLQEPLRTIRSFVDMLVEESGADIDDRTGTYLHYIASGAQRMSRLVQDLLEYSQLGRNPQYSTVDCRELLDEVLADMAATIYASGAEIEIGDMPSIETSAAELRRLFQNLVSNAIKFRKPRVRPSISISAQSTETGWLFSVTDNGIGIEEAHRESIFLIFHRLHSEQEYSGTGIGLAQCRKIVDALGGDLWVESVAGEGSTFYFTLNDYRKEAV